MTQTVKGFLVLEYGSGYNESRVDSEGTGLK